MLLVGRYSKEISVNPKAANYETNNSFTKFIHAPVRDSSLFAAARAKSASAKRLKIGLEKKQKKLECFKLRLSVEKQKFDVCEKLQIFYGNIEKTIETLWKAQVIACTKIQANFRGYIYRKQMLQVKATQLRIQMDRELTKKLIREMEAYSTDCFYSVIGVKV